jgi:hypothetical protein
VRSDSENLMDSLPARVELRTLMDLSERLSARRRREARVVSILAANQTTNGQLKKYNRKLWIGLGALVSRFTLTTYLQL